MSGPEDSAAAEGLDAGSSALVDAYLDHLRVERRLSPNTLESYARDLVHLGRFAAGRGTPLASLDRRALEAFVRDLMSSGSPVVGSASCTREACSRCRSAWMGSCRSP